MLYSHMRNLLKNLLALLLGLLIIVFIELLLSVSGVVPLASQDPFVGFTGSSPVIIKSGTDADTYILNPNKATYFNPQKFLFPKPAGTFRIVSFGGSTTYGRPYINDTSFPRWLAGLFNLAQDRLQAENINLGGISYASYRVALVAEEMTRYSPDLYIIYAGHNEFLESRTFEKILREPGFNRLIRSVAHRSRIYSLLYRAIRGGRVSERTILRDDVDARLEEIGGYELYHRDQDFQQGVIAQFRHSLEKIIRLCRKENIPLVLCTLPSNLRGISPFKSEHRQGLTPQQLQQWEDLFRTATGEWAQGNSRAALNLIEKAEELDGSFALLHYVKGQILFDLGATKEAYNAFLRAKEEDIVPLRALDACNSIVRNLAKENGLPLADVESAFIKATPGGVPGNELFVDHVHPTIKGQQLIAWTVLEAAASAGAIPFDPFKQSDFRKRSLDFLASRYNQVSARYIAMGYWGVGRLYHWAGKLPEARESLLAAWKTVKDIAEIPYLLGDIELINRNPERAMVFFQEAENIGGEKARVSHGKTRAALQLKKGKQALAFLQEVPEKYRDPIIESGLYGEAYLLMGRTDEAVIKLQEAVRKTPGVKRFLLSLAQAYIMKGEDTLARETFERYALLANLSEDQYDEFHQITLGTFKGVPRQ